MIFEIFFFKSRKKKWKNDFFHFSHIITKFFIYNLNEFYKREKIIRNSFSLYNVQFRCLILLRHFVFRFMKHNIFFYCFLKSNQFFNIFLFFWNLSSRSIFIILLLRNEVFNYFIKTSNRIVIVICEKIYRRFVFLYKKFDIKECWNFAYFKKYT